MKYYRVSFVWQIKLSDTEGHSLIDFLILSLLFIKTALIKKKPTHKLYLNC